MAPEARQETRPPAGLAPARRDDREVPPGAPVVAPMAEEQVRMAGGAEVQPGHVLLQKPGLPQASERLPAGVEEGAVSGAGADVLLGAVVWAAPEVEEVLGFQLVLGVGRIVIGTSGWGLPLTG